MNYYKVLGIEENATQEEVKEAYNRQVEKFREEVKDEKRLEKFLAFFKEAYDALNLNQRKVLRSVMDFFMMRKKILKKKL